MDAQFIHPQGHRPAPASQILTEDENDKESSHRQTHEAGKHADASSQTGHSKHSNQSSRQQEPGGKGAFDRQLQVEESKWLFNFWGLSLYLNHTMNKKKQINKH